MTEDIETGYPTDYYKLRRRVSKEIKEQIEGWVLRLEAGNEVTKKEINDWAMNLSIRSGIPKRGIVKLFADISPKTQEWFT